MSKKSKDKGAEEQTPVAPKIDMSNVAALAEMLCSNGVSMGTFGAIVSFFQNAGPGFQMEFCAVVGSYLESLTEDGGMKNALSAMLPEDEEPTEQDVVLMSEYINERAAAVLAMIEPIIEDEDDEDEDDAGDE